MVFIRQIQMAWSARKEQQGHLAAGRAGRTAVRPYAVGNASTENPTKGTFWANRPARRPDFFLKKMPFQMLRRFGGPIGRSVGPIRRINGKGQKRTCTFDSETLRE
jgi:hypothetical protein